MRWESMTTTKSGRRLKLRKVELVQEEHMDHKLSQTGYSLTTVLAEVCGAPHSRTAQHPMQGCTEGLTNLNVNYSQ